MVTVGLAFTTVPVEALKPPVGVHAYTPFPPVAVRFMAVPMHIDGETGVMFSTFTPVVASMMNVHLSALNPSIIK